MLFAISGRVVTGAGETLKRMAVCVRGSDSTGVEVSGDWSLTGEDGGFLLSGELVAPADGGVELQLLDRTLRELHRERVPPKADDLEIVLPERQVDDLIAPGAGPPPIVGPWPAALRVAPAEAVVPVGTTVFFAAYPCDDDGSPVGSVAVYWTACDAYGREVPMGSDGAFIARGPGAYRVTASALAPDDMCEKADSAAVEAAALVVVRDEEGDIQDAEYDAHSSSEPGRAALRRADAAPETPWGDGNATSAFDPVNRVGSFTAFRQLEDEAADIRPLSGDAAFVGSGSFRLDIPLIQLEGRGNVGVDLNLTYNSKLWHEDGGYVRFDVDRGWPGPGWSLGFGRLVRVGETAGTMLVDSDGTRHPFEVVDSGGNWTDGHWFNCSTSDGTFIDYSHKDGGVDASAQWGKARYLDGTSVDYTAQGHDIFNWRLGQTFPSRGVLWPTRLQDAHGNVVVVTYRDDLGPEIDSIVDSLGRAVVFHYDARERLTAITASGLGGAPRTVARFNWIDLRLTGLELAFRPLREGQAGEEPRAIGPDGRPARALTITALRAVFFPGTSTGYWFGEPFTYSGYGMLTRVSQHRAMGFDGAPLTDQGLITPGTVTRQRTYDYPVTPARLDAAPTYSTLTETWDGMDSGPAVTTYRVERDDAGSRRLVHVTQPDGVRTVTSLHMGTAEFDGQPFELDVFAGAQRVRRIKDHWERGDHRSPRIARREVTDRRGQTTATEFSYGSLDRLTETREFDYDGALLRRVTTAYEPMSTGPYVATHVFGLPTVVEVFQGSDPTPSSRVEHRYDTEPLRDAPGVLGHAPTHNPWLPGADPDTRFRGNRTETTTWAEPVQRLGPVIEQRTYDITGNVVVLAGPGAYREAREYAATTRYGMPERVVVGAPQPGEGDRNVTVASYDVSSGLVRSITDANGRSTQYAYDDASLRPRRVTSSTGATVESDYEDAALRIRQTTRLPDASVAGQTIAQTNGIGLVRREATLAPGIMRGSVEPARQLRVNRQLQATVGGQWTGWGVSGGPAARDVRVIAHADGRLHAFVTGVDGQLWHAEQQSTGGDGTWTPWLPLSRPGDRGDGLTVASDGGGHLRAFMIDADRQVQTSEQLHARARADWSQWLPFAPEDDDPAAWVTVHRGPDRRLHAFMVRTDGQLRSGRVGDALGGWTAFAPDDLHAESLSVVVNGDGGLHVFVVAPGGQLWHREQFPIEPERWEWGDWSFLTQTGHTARNLTVVAAADGRLHAFIIALDGQVGHNQQLAAAAGSAWTGWQVLSDLGEPARDLTVVANADGRLHAFTVDASGLLRHSDQTGSTIGASWTPWSELVAGGRRAGLLQVEPNPDGRLHAFIVDVEGELAHSEQIDSRVGSHWTAWTPLSQDGDRAAGLTVAAGHNGWLFGFAQALGGDVPAADTVLTQYDAMVGHGDVRDHSEARSPQPGPRRPTTPSAALRSCVSPTAANRGFTTTRRTGRAVPCRPIVRPDRPSGTWTRGGVSAGCCATPSAASSR